MQIFNKKNLFLFLCAISFSVTLYSQEYSVKNRWNIKASYSLYKTEYKFSFSGNNGIDFDGQHMNWRIEGNYGLLDWMEVGIYGGFQKYETHFDIYDGHENPVSAEIENAYAPTFGVNLNVHILPLFVKKQSRWELYFTAKYGGCYLTKFGGDDGTRAHNYYNDFAEPNTNHYRHEYGLGLGGGVYFWNLVGIYAEASFGQYSFAPEIFTDNFSLRGGISFKIGPKKK
ncbi:MAG: hypothetical protein LBH92_01905 [Bacteroidales bacterium]|jgi:hypothetical protein|nr:hypothetical protein [Bacteroidales bacterium]